MIAYIVVKGERGEGGSIVSVRKTKKAAISDALAVKTYFEGGWIADGPTSWENGCDYVLWQRWKVK